MTNNQKILIILKSYIENTWNVDIFYDIGKNYSMLQVSSLSLIISYSNIEDILRIHYDKEYKFEAELIKLEINKKLKNIEIIDIERDESIFTLQKEWQNWGIMYRDSPVIL